MKALIQRVSKASVSVDDKIIGAIDQGVLVFLGVLEGDSEKEVDYLVKKVLEYRIFCDENGRMNKSLLDIKGEALVISQFTLAADGKKGRRPSFDQAASPLLAKPLYEKFIRKLETFVKTECGCFGAKMLVSIENDGPATFMLDYKC
ncbi:D-aminoacyl-tRNA deacylase [Candidatus Uabimicrobium sp. HlEnr_7]|uniref:D-aminoacyl-tRNA deacylase n=1 Tax=Candidatus Uabimicrobium helgolandensis TaxID=3095367 RepID=UPI0035569832